MPSKRNFIQLVSKVFQFLSAGQFTRLASKIAFYIRDENKLMQRRKSLRTHGSTVLAEVMEICRQTGIRPYLTFGSLLGYRRNSGLIGGDDDLDFGLSEADRPDIPAFIEAMKNRGFLLKAEHRLEGPLAVIGDHCEITFIHRTGVSIDFYFHHHWTDTEIIFAADKKLIGHFHEGLLKHTPVDKNQLIGYALSYPGDLARNFVSANFLGTDILVPAQTDAYLARIYGNWKIPQKIFFYKNVSAILAKSSGPGIELIRLPAPALDGSIREDH